MSGRLPDYIIIGTQRSGSTSLHNYIQAHPDVARVGRPKREIHFFDYPHNWKRGVEWYKAQFASVPDGKVCGDKTPTLMDHLLAPERVAKVCPRARLLLILRNPVDRAYSDFYKIRRKGMEPLTSFEAAIDAEPRRMAEEDVLGAYFWLLRYFKSSHHVRSYLRRGVYADFIPRWIKGPNALFIIKAESLFESPQETMRSVYAFLGLEPHRLQRFVQYQAAEYAPMEQEMRQRLERYYWKPNERLAQLLGDDIWLWK